MKPVFETYLRELGYKMVMSFTVPFTNTRVQFAWSPPGKIAPSFVDGFKIYHRLLRFCGKRDQYWKNPKTNTDARRLMADAERWLKREDVRQSAECQERLAPEVNALIHHVSFALSNSREEKDAACRAVEIGLPSGSSRRS